MRYHFSVTLVVLLAGCATPSRVAPPSRPSAPAAADVDVDAIAARVEADRLAAVASARAAETSRLAAEQAAREQAMRAQAHADSVRTAEATRAAARPVRYAHGTVNVRASPGTSGDRLAQLGRNDTVFVEGCEAGWCRVAAPTGNTWTVGYISEPLLHPSASAAATASTRTAGGSRRTSGRTDSRSAMCASYASQAAAQAALDADPVGLSELDREACESQFRSSRTRTPRAARSRPAATRTCYTGPRGGRYYISASGRRVYGC